jgi:heat shock protein HtpX
MPAAITIAPRRSVAFFAFLAIVMIFFSYAFVVLLAAACVYFPYLAVSDVEHIHGQLVALFLGGIVIACTMLWSILPRRHKFEPPGVLLERSAHPLLFAEIDNIATALNEPPPHEVYLNAQVNAFVADRGGTLGFGSRRIMAIGLPLFSILSVSEFRGILAHECAHYYGGDTRMGPWVYKAQSAMIRNLENIGSLYKIRIGAVQILNLVVGFILKQQFILFLRVINFVSRKKEYRADELACLIAGLNPFLQGLRKIHGADVAWIGYWQSEVAPVLERGFIPSLADGFSRFVSLPEVSNLITTVVQSQLDNTKTDPYNSHPPLRDRIAAIGGIDPSPATEDSAMALSLLQDPESAELDLVAFLGGKKESLQRVGWNDVARIALIPYWKSFVTENAALLQGVSVESIPDLIRQLPEIGSRMRDPAGRLLTAKERTQRAGRLLATALSLTILEKGWQVEHQPGVFYFHRGEEKADIFATVDELIDGKLPREAWPAQCARLGMSGSLLWTEAPVISGPSQAVLQ